MGFKNIRMIIYEFKQVRVIFKFHRGFTWNIFIPNQMQMILNLMVNVTASIDFSPDRTILELFSG